MKKALFTLFCVSLLCSACAQQGITPGSPASKTANQVNTNATCALDCQQTLDMCTKRYQVGPDSPGGQQGMQVCTMGYNVCIDECDKKQ